MIIGIISFSFFKLEKKIIVINGFFLVLLARQKKRSASQILRFSISVLNKKKCSTNIFLPGKPL